MRSELSDPAAFPPPRPRRVDVEETHASWVFLGERDVFKVKKPVDFGFLDFRTIEQRRRACEAEVTLNRRLAPEAYLGVVAVVRRPDGRLGFGGDGLIVDWAVHMLRMPDAERADHLLAGGALSEDAIQAIADRIAAFHAAATSGAEAAAYGTTEVIALNVRENFAQTHAALARYLTPDEAREIEEWQLGFLQVHPALFADRIAAGRVRDGHGDLRLEHVYVGEQGALTILDCIEFNERFRFADVCADIAFLSMDLAWHGRADLAELFLARYARASGDHDLYALVDFYESYRAYVRGKIATFAAESDDAPPFLRETAAKEARRYFLLALSAHRRSLLEPVLVAVGGVIASGKSTVADAIGAALSAPVIDADRTRKHMLGLESTAPAPDAAWQGAYDPAVTEKVYAEVLRRAGVVLASGRPAVIDASFRSVGMRRAARDLARARGVPFRFVECRVDVDVARARLRAREHGVSVSDGRLAIFDAFCARFERVDELPPEEHVVLDTSQALTRSLAELESRVATWPHIRVP